MKRILKNEKPIIFVIFVALLCTQLCNSVMAESTNNTTDGLNLQTTNQKEDSQPKSTEPEITKEKASEEKTTNITNEKNQFTQTKTEQPFNFTKTSTKSEVKIDKPQKNSKYTIHIKGKTIDLKRYLSLTTIFALFGLAGTFFGLFSTWLIYHLNRKNNNPLIIDKHNSAIQYFDELNQIKIHFANSDIESAFAQTTAQSNEENLKRLTISYENICKNISKIDLIKIHTRYKKHIKKHYTELFNTLIDSYKMIKIDGDYLNNSTENYHMFDFNCITTAEIINSLKNKTLAIIKFEEQIDVILGILKKELKLKN